MKKVLNFVFNTKKGEKILLTTCVMMMISFVIGLILCIPAFWMSKEYVETWMNTVAPYFFYPFIGYAALMLFLFAPYMWYIGTSEKYEGDKRLFLKGMAIFLSIFPGAIIYNSFIVEALFIPSGIHNLGGMLICGMLYLLIVKTILKKPFNVAQIFISLS